MLLEVLLLAQGPRLPRAGASLPPLPTSLALIVKAPGGEARAAVDPGKEPGEARPRATLQAGQTPQIRWQVKNTDRRIAVRTIVVHFLVTPQRAAGEPLPRGPQQGRTIDVVLGTDLSPGAVATGNYNTPIHDPGIYLVEIELLDAQGNRRHYCVAELEVVPK